MTLYDRVIQNRPLSTSFFDDSSNESGDDDCDSDEEERSFKFNKDHCLYIFNTLKHGYGNQSNVTNSAYLNLSYQNKAEYLRHLELIDLQLDLPKLAAFRNITIKGKQRRSDTLQSSDSNELPIPPKTLRDIFKISNNNRKKNKMRKKSKLESYASQSTEILESTSSSSAAPPPTNVH